MLFIASYQCEYCWPWLHRLVTEMALAGTCSGRLLVSVTYSELATLLYTVVGQPREQLTVATMVAKYTAGYWRYVGEVLKVCMSLCGLLSSST